MEPTPMATQRKKSDSRRHDARISRQAMLRTNFMSIPPRAGERESGKASGRAGERASERERERASERNFPRLLFSRSPALPLSRSLPPSFPIFHNPPLAQADHAVSLVGQPVVVRDEQERRVMFAVEFDEQSEDVRAEIGRASLG